MAKEIFLQKKRDYYLAHKNDKNHSEVEIKRQRSYKTQKKRELRKRKKNELENPSQDVTTTSSIRSPGEIMDVSIVEEEILDTARASTSKQALPKKKSERVNKCYKDLREKDKESKN